MANFVYTLVFDENGNFLIFLKLPEAYFFQADKGPGAIFPTGKPIVNGPESMCFPGGKSKGHWTTPNIIQNARREFIEECGRSIEFKEVAEDIEIPLAHTVFKFEYSKNMRYAGYYVQVASSDLAKIFAYLQGTSLLERAKAAAAIEAGAITQYDQIEASFPNAPYDDELQSVFIWNLQDNARDIASLKGCSDTGWFYDIIMILPELIGN